MGHYMCRLVRIDGLGGGATRLALRSRLFTSGASAMQFVRALGGAKPVGGHSLTNHVGLQPRLATTSHVQPRPVQPNHTGLIAPRPTLKVHILHRLAATTNERVE